MAQSTKQAGAGRLRKLLLAAAGLQQSSRNVGDPLFHRCIHNHRIKRPSIVHKRSTDILHDPWFNKGTAFPATERDRLGLRGLLPPKVMTFEQQYERFMVDFRQLEANTTDGADDMNALAKWRILNRLHDRNETLYYHVLIKNIKHFAPIIYTPTIGLVCQRYSGLFRRPRGMYFTADDRGEMMSMIYNWPAEQVQCCGMPIFFYCLNSITDDS
jgi:malate dehydrogenase (decarboxylating)